MKNRMNNILRYKTLSRLPQESGFYSGDCPGAAAITILTSFFSSPWGTLGRKTVSDFPSKGRAGLFPVGKPGRLISRQKAGQAYSLFQEKENKEHRIYPPAAEGLTYLLVANPDGAASSVRVETTNKPGTGSIEGRNIPVLRTFGFYWYSSATNITGALHLEFQTSFAAIGETAAAPRKICSPASHPSGKKVQRTETLKENIGYRITNVESGRDQTLNLISNETSMSFLSPFRQLADGRGEAKYKAAPLLPRGRFYSGDCPGAAAITIILSLFSSPRVSPIRSACKGLPVTNRQASHRSSFVPWQGGQDPEYSGDRGSRGRVPGDKRSIKRPGVSERMASNQKGGTPMS